MSVRKLLLVDPYQYSSKYGTRNEVKYLLGIRDSRVDELFEYPETNRHIYQHILYDKKKNGNLLIKALTERKSVELTVFIENRDIVKLTILYMLIFSGHH